MNKIISLSSDFMVGNKGYHYGNLLNRLADYISMSSVITKTEFEVYSYFYNKYGLKPFGIDTLKWFFSSK